MYTDPNTGSLKAHIIDVTAGTKKRGIGTMLVWAAITESRRAGCDVITGNLEPPDDVKRLVGFYGRFGFVAWLYLNNDRKIAGRIKKKL